MTGYATSREVAEYLGVAAQTVDYWASKGKGPTFRKIGGRRRYLWTDLRAYAEQRSGGDLNSPILTCSGCSKPVTEDGFIGVPMQEVGRAQKERRAHEAANADSRKPVDLSTVPRPADWAVFHFACDTGQRGSWYTYTVERVDTWPKFMSFLAHVAEKQWVRLDTDLSRLLRRVSGEQA